MRTIEVISIPVSSQERSKEFYLNIGFELIVESPMGNGQNWVQLGLPGKGATISLVSWWPYPEVSMSPGSFQGLVLESEDIEKEFKELQAKGIEIGTFGRTGYESGKIMDTPWGKFAHFKDPDGNGINLHQQ